MTDHLGDPEVRRTERATHIVILMVVLFLLVPLLLWPGVASLVWWLQPDSTIDVLVYDQTVPDGSYLEHASLGMVFEYEKVLTEDSFVGASPGGVPHGSWPSIAPDLVMLVDAYGVYLDETGQVSDQGSNRVTEAFEESDADRVAGWAANGTVVYGEFNILGEPTASSASQQLQDLFGVEQTGWAGRYFDDLATVPDRTVAFSGSTWDHTGPGVVLLAPQPEGSLVVVLDSDTMESPFPVVEGVVPGSSRAVSARLDGWFEVIAANSAAEVDMWARLPVTAAGRSMLDRQGIPTEWPFLVRSKNSLYLAADASENTVEFPLRKMTGSAALMRTLPHSAQTEFFYRVYIPVVQWLLATAESSGPSP